MRTQFDLEQTFKELDSFPRTEEQSRKSYQKILKKTKYRKNKWVNPIILNIATITIFLGFTVGSILHISNKPELIPESIQAISLLNDEKVLSTHVTTSKTNKSFSINTNSGLNPGTILINDDKIWNKNLEIMLSTLSEAKTIPHVEPQYDMFIKLSGNTNLKLKIYETEQGVIVKDLNKNMFFEVEDKSAAFLWLVLNNVPEIK